MKLKDFSKANISKVSDTAQLSLIALLCLKHFPFDCYYKSLDVTEIDRTLYMAIMNTLIRIYFKWKGRGLGMLPFTDRILLNAPQN